MSSSSIDSELSPQPFIPANIDNYEAEVDSSDWETKMAKLVGFEEESPRVNLDAPEADRENLQPSQSQPPQVSTEEPLSSNPFAKLALVGGGTLTLVLVAGVFLTQIMTIGNQKPKNNLVSSAASLPPKTEPQEPNLEQEIETLKTKLALAAQTQAITAAQQNLRNRVASQLTNPPVNNSKIKPVQTAATPRIITVERIITKPIVTKVFETKPIETKPIVTKPSSSPVVVPPVAVTPTVTPTVAPAYPADTLEELTTLLMLGSDNQVDTTAQFSVNTANQGYATPLLPKDDRLGSRVAETPRRRPEENTSVILPREASKNNFPLQPTNSQPQPTPTQPDTLISQLQPQNSQSVKVGTSAKAILLTAVFGETTRSRNNERNDQKDENSNVFVVQLKEPLKSLNGAIALPANTELLAQIRSLSEAGLLQLDVVKVITQDKGQLQEKNLPNNAITVRAPQGRPLIANKFPNNGSSIAKMDTGLFVLGGISKAAELLNRIDTEVTTNAGSTIVSNSNGQRNLAAGILEGGLKSVVPQISQRNQQAISQMMQQTNLWLIPAGLEVEIYVNRTMQF